MRISISIEDLLTNDDFIRFVVAPTPELTLSWINQFRRQPELIGNAAEAARILNERSSSLNENEKVELFHRILEHCR